MDSLHSMVTNLNESHTDTLLERVSLVVEVVYEQMEMGDKI